MLRKLPLHVKNTLRPFRDALVQAAAVPVSGLLQVLPRHVRVQVNSRTRVVGRMDYHNAPISMIVESPTELARLRSCLKEPGTVKWIEEFMGPDDVLFDIGANVGAYSLIAASRIGNGTGKVVAFEPSYRNFSRLNENIELNGYSDRVIAVSLALSNAIDIAVFRFSSTEIGAALHNLEGATLRSNARSGVAASHVLTVPLDRLMTDYRLPMPTLIKLDVDGPELEILQGASELLCRPELKSLQIEVEPDEGSRSRIRSFLEARGWVLRGRNTHYGNAVDEDWVWVRAG